MTNKAIISTDKAPEAIGTYSQAVKTNNTVYLSGQIPLDPKTMTLVDGDFAVQTHQVFKNIKAVLTEAGMTLENVVKCSVFVADMEMYGRINAVYAQYFDEENAPARELVEVANLPKYVNVEISCIAV